MRINIAKFNQCLISIFKNSVLSLIRGNGGGDPPSGKPREHAPPPLAKKEGEVLAPTVKKRADSKPPHIG